MGVYIIRILFDVTFALSIAKTMKTIAEKYWKYALFTIVGAGIGLAYWRFVGCATGTCPVSSSWHMSIFTGGLIGMLIVPAGKGKPNGNTKTD